MHLVVGAAAEPAYTLEQPLQLLVALQKHPHFEVAFVRRERVHFKADEFHPCPAVELFFIGRIAVGALRQTLSC